MESKARIGIGLTGSFCTFEAVFGTLQQLQEDTQLQFVLSYHTQQLQNRFSPPDQTLQRIAALSELPPICTIDAAEPIGPKSLLDLFVIAPCTGNTLAKLANGITDTPEPRINNTTPKVPLSVGFNCLPFRQYYSIILQKVKKK